MRRSFGSFSVELPAEWQVLQRDHGEHDPAAEERLAFEDWLALWSSNRSRDEQALLAWGQQTGEQALTALIDQRGPDANRAMRALNMLLEIDERRSDSDRRRPLGMQVEYTSVEALDANDGTLDVTRYCLSAELPVLDFYRSAKPNKRGGPRGTRTTIRPLIDGAPTVRLYADWGMYQPRDEDWPKFVCHYLSDGLAGWVIEVGCERRRFDRLRTELLAISASFQRSTAA